MIHRELIDLYIIDAFYLPSEYYYLSALFFYFVLATIKIANLLYCTYIIK